MTTDGPSRRVFTVKYFLPLSSGDDSDSIQRVQVCHNTFTKTLNVSCHFIRTAHNKLNQDGVTEGDRRGKRKNHQHDNDD